MILLLLFVVLLVLLWYDRYCGSKNHPSVRSLAGPRAYPFIGNGYDFLGSASDFLYNLDGYCRKFGSRFRVLFGPKVMIVLSDPADVEVVLSSNELLDKAEEYEYLHDWLGLGLLTSSGEKWRRHRKFLTPAFHFSILRHFIPVFDKRTDTFVEKLAAYADGRPVDVYPLAARCALDQISETVMGTSTEKDTEANLEYIKSVHTLTDLINERIRNVFMRVNYLFKLSSSYKVYTKCLNFVKNYADNMIKKRMNLLKETGVDMAYYTKDYDDLGVGSRKCVAFLDLMLLSDMEGKKMQYNDVKNEVDTFLFEGHDTTASGLSFTLYLISQHQDVQQKLYDEQMKICDGDIKRDITYRDVNDMKYMELVLKESMRMYPPVPFVARRIMKPFQLNDITFPPNVNIAVNVFSMCRDPKHFPDPLTFNPERFVGDDYIKSNPFSYVVFSAGPRNCIGQKFAMLMMKLTVAKIIRHYRLLTAEAPPMLLTGDITLKSANGIYVCLRKRE